MRCGRCKAGSSPRAVMSRRAWCAVGALSKNTAAAAAQVLLKILGVRLKPDTTYGRLEPDTTYGGLEPALGEPRTTVKRTTPPVTARALMFHRPGTTDGEDRQRQSKLEDDAADEQLNFGRVHRDR